MILVNIIHVLQAEAKHACSRCALGDSSARDDDGEYSHGCDDYRPPEPCQASSLWRVADLLELQYARQSRSRLHHRRLPVLHNNANYD